MKLTGEELCVKMVLDAWNSKIEKAHKLLNSLSEEDLSKDISFGKNSGKYLLGHLAAVHDKLIPLLGFGESLYPILYNTFVLKSDKTGEVLPTAAYLKETWKHVNDNLNLHFQNTSVPKWFEKHASVTEQEFANEPHRNKLNVVISRTNHLEYHLGQLILLK